MTEHTRTLFPVRTNHIGLLQRAKEVFVAERTYTLQEHDSWFVQPTLELKAIHAQLAARYCFRVATNHLVMYWGPHLDDISGWLNSNCQDTWYYSSRELCFEAENDAMLFKLRWVG